ncbi:MAG: hypothetical protein P8N51_07375 [Pseudomonadales bacterium]|nr:hypothetical protein [Pseudomonadales bacterium]
MFLRQLFDTESSAYSYLLADDRQALIINPVLEKTSDHLQLLG